MKLRAHHGMCLSFFRGKGYSEGFTAHMAKIKEELESDPAQLIEIVQTMDVICVACPHNKQGVCDTQEKVERYDAAVLRYCLGHSDKTPPDTPEERRGGKESRARGSPDH